MYTTILGIVSTYLALSFALKIKFLNLTNFFIFSAQLIFIFIFVYINQCISNSIIYFLLFGFFSTVLVAIYLMKNVSSYHVNSEGDEDAE